MRVAAAEGEQPNRVGVDAAAPPLRPSGDDRRSAGSAAGSASLASPASDESVAGSAGSAESGPRSSEGGEPPGEPEDSPSEPLDSSPQPFSLVDLLLLDPEDSESVAIDVVTFSDAGIGVIRSRGERPRVLPWASVTTYVVEPWSGGVIPEWWVDPELNRRRAPPGPAAPVTDPRATNRARPGSEPGALIGIKTPSQTYRFLLPGGDAREISHKVATFALKFQGPTAASSVTRVVRWGQDVERRSVPRTPKREISWAKVQPFLVVALIVFLAASVTIILLQSSGAIHLPFLGGVGSGTLSTPGRPGVFRTG